MDTQNKSLTLEDLAKFTEDVLLPAITTIVDETVERKLDEKLEQKLEQKLAPIRQDIIEMKQDIADIKQELSAIRHELDAINRRLDKLEQRTKEDSDAYGSDILDLRARVKRLELEVVRLENK